MTAWLEWERRGRRREGGRRKEEGGRRREGRMNRDARREAVMDERDGQRETWCKSNG